MGDAKLQIVIDALNKASDDLKNIKKDLGDLNKSAQDADKGAKGFGQSWAGVMTGINSGIQIIQTAAAAMREVYDAAKEGAELEFAATRFDNLAKSIGTVSDALLDDLREATSGMISDSELMASAADFMGLGLAKTHDEVVRLATVSGALGMNMNQLVLTLTNQTTMRFDALGVSVDGFDAKVKALKDSGMDANAAFTEAFLQQAESQIEKVGNAADSTKGSFSKLEASVKNGSDSMKKELSNALAPAIENLTNKLDSERSTVDSLTKAMELGIITQETFYKYASHEGMRRYGDEIETTTKKVIEYEAAIDQSAEDQIAFYIAAAQSGEAVGEVAKQTISADLAMRSYNEVLLFSIASKGLSEEAALNLAIAMGLVDEKTVYATEKINTWSQMLNNGEIDLETYNALVKGLNDSLKGLPSDVNVDVSMALRKDDVDSYLANLNRSVTIPVYFGVVSDADQARAVGGMVYAGNPYNWQEYGYRGELLVPSANGYVLSRADAERAVSSAVNNSGGSVYGGPSADDIARAVRDAILTAGII